jgi:formamidopyrimidine-DNA glycosylase
MPELPEVETIVRQLKSLKIEGRTILDVKVMWDPMVNPLNKNEFIKQLISKKIKTIQRVGKWIHFKLSCELHLLIHLRMAGSFSQITGKYDRISLHFNDNLSLFYHDTRKFGRWLLVKNPESIFNNLGPDIFSNEFNCKYFEKQIKKRKWKIKQVLLDQSILAGIGNIYADEALWESQIHPERFCNTLLLSEIKCLYISIKNVLTRGIENQGTSLGKGKTNYRDLNGKSGQNKEKVNAYGRGGFPCLRCQTELKKIKLAQRGTTFCPKCQII